MRRTFSYLLLALAVPVSAAIVLGGHAPQAGGYRLGQFDRGPLATTVTASGTITPITSVEVSSQLSGQVSELFADFNDTVAKGETLARLDPRSFEARVIESEAELAIARADVETKKAAVARARAELAHARAEAVVMSEKSESQEADTQLAKLLMDRKQTLRQRNVVSGSDAEEAKAAYLSEQALLRAARAEEQVRLANIDAVKSGLSMAESAFANAQATTRLMDAKLASARIELDRTLIRSPIAGTVIKRNVKLGQTVAASLMAPTLFTIAEDLRRMKVEAYVDEADIGLVRMGQRATFTVDAYTGKTFEGQIEQIRKAPEVFENVVTYLVVIAADNAGLALFPGMTASVQIVVGNVADALRAPNAALRYSPATDAAGNAEPLPPGTGRVWLRDEAGNPKPVILHLGITDSIRTEVRDGAVVAGDRVIVGDPLPVDDGILVRLRDAARSIPMIGNLLAAGK